MSSPVTPKDAAAVVLLKNEHDPQVFWVKRGPSQRFMAGYHAFPGGQIDEDDASIKVLNCEDASTARVLACAAREIFEETGVLIAEGSELLSQDRLRRLREEVASGETPFSRLLEREGLRLNARRFILAPRWITPPHMQRRFDTRFLAAWLPEGQTTEVHLGELESGEWLSPREALARWRDGESLIATPILDILRSLSNGVDDFAERLNTVPQDERDEHQRVELCEGFLICALRTPTIPPATHTNCYIVGGDELVIVDPGSPYPEEQARLDRLVEVLLGEGKKLREILITHLHHDHIAGVNHLRERFEIPVAAHRLTASAISSTVTVDRMIDDGELIVLGGEPYWRLRAVWTPGHAKGHLSFYEERTGTVLTGDLVVGYGTVVIAPPEGNLTDYMRSLARLLEFPRLSSLMPGHGPVLADARRKIEEYVSHRHDREGQILGLLDARPRTVSEMVEAIYPELAPELRHLAAATIEAHLEKLVSERRVVVRGGVAGKV
jgi:glyoxylase-like metal-dependent hydrolase (beta-lactamase superfamily II)/8-oxo-dGTP pyrophosphatase MutT (NUDIX family)